MGRCIANFIKWSELLAPTAGFVGVDGSVVVEAHIHVLEQTPATLESLQAELRRVRKRGAELEAKVVVKEQHPTKKRSMV